MKNKLNQLILAFGAAKLLLHFLTNTNYGLHRDEFLYFDEGQNLAWGFMEVPPFTPFIGALADLLGGSVFAIRLFPALAGTAIVLLAGFLVKELGGKKWAIVFTCLPLVLSVALCWSNTLFQPVTFNQLFWFLTAFWLVKIIKTEEKKYWYCLGITIGIGLLTKYSIVFYLIALLVAVLMTRHRKLFTTKYPYLAMVIALLIALPNILWQINHNFPVLAHMETLSQNQLVHINWGQYLNSQLTFHFASSVVWIAGLVALFKVEQLKNYRFLGIALILTVLLIGALSGKSYYTAGAFLILFPFGGLFLENLIQKPWIRYTSIAAFIALVLLFLPFSLPLLKMDKMLQYCAFMKDKLGMDAELRWEDGKYYALPQDMADMNGWEEMAQKVAQLYHSLPPERQKTCLLYGGAYAHAGSINYYRHKYNLPKVYSFNSSYIIWAPTEVQFDNQIMIDDTPQTSSNWFQHMVLVDSIQDPYAREKGYIYYRDSAKIDVVGAWREVVLDGKKQFNLR